MIGKWQTVNFTVGDPTKAGHGISQDVQIRVNASAEAIRDAFESASAALGFNMINDVANNAAQRDGDLLPLSYELAIRKIAGKRLQLKAERRRKLIVLTPQVWVRLIMIIVQYANAEIKYRILQYPTLYVGGYDILLEQAAYERKVIADAAVAAAALEADIGG